MQIPPKPWPTGLSQSPETLVRRVLAPNPSPYTYTGTQTYLVGGAEKIAVIDPGPDDPDHLAALEAAIGDASIAAIMCTHTHRDHSPAAKPLAARTGAPLWAARRWCWMMGNRPNGARARMPRSIKPMRPTA